MRSRQATAPTNATELKRRALTAGSGKVFWDVASRSLGLVFSIVLARSLGAEGFGMYSVVWYVGWMLSQLTDLGLHLVALRSLSREWRPSVFWSVVATKALASLFVLSGFFIALAAGFVHAKAGFVFFLLAAQLTASWAELLGVVLRSRGGIAREGTVSSCVRAGWLVGALWFLMRGGYLEQLGLPLALGSLPGLVLAVVLVMRPPLGNARASRSQMASLAREALPLGAIAVITLVYLRADLLILAALRDSVEAGLFASAFRLFEATFVLSGGIAAGTFPLLVARAEREGFPALARFVLRLLACLALPLAAAFVFGAESLLALVFGETFRRAAPALAFLGVALPAVFVNALTTHLLIAFGRHRRLVTCMLIRLVVGIAIDLLLIPTLGAKGAAAAVAVAEWSLTAASLAAVRDRLPLSFFVRNRAEIETSGSRSAIGGSDARI